MISISSLYKKELETRTESLFLLLDNEIDPINEV